MCLKGNCWGFQQTPSEIKPGISIPILFMPKLKSFGVAPTSPILQFELNVGESGIRRASAAVQNGPPAFWPKPAVLYAGVYNSHLCPCVVQLIWWGQLARFLNYSPKRFSTKRCYVKGRKIVQFRH